MQIIGVPAKSVDNAVDGMKFIVDMLTDSVAKSTLYFSKSTKYLTPELVEETITQLVKDDALLKDFVKKIYKRDQNARERVVDAILDSKTFQKFVNKIKEVAGLFYTIGTNKKTINDIINDFSKSAVEGMPGKCVVLNFTLYKTHDRALGLRSKYVRETLRSLYFAGIDIYNNVGDINLNTLVVLEEAHNYAPKFTDNEDLKKLSDEIVKYYIETRKFGIGWACITTRPSNVRREIFEHSRVKIIGMGLTSGPDADLLRESFGSDFLKIYRLLPDPSDPLSPRKEVNFVISGPITLLSREGTDFITVFNTKEEFLKCNGYTTTNNNTC
jgi:DNA helicase HerA-like ATPase